MPEGLVSKYGKCSMTQRTMPKLHVSCTAVTQFSCQDIWGQVEQEATDLPQHLPFVDLAAMPKSQISAFPTASTRMFS